MSFNRNIIELIDDEYIIGSTQTSVREDAFVMDDDLRIELMKSIFRFIDKSKLRHKVKDV